MSTTLEKTVQEEQEQYERDQDIPATTEGDGAPLEDPDGQTAIIDRSQYEREDLAIAKVDGNAIDRIRLTFSGTVSLDRSEPADVALYNKLVLGRGVTLMVEGRCAGTGAKEATGRDGDLDVIVGQKTVAVTTVYIPAVEDLETELARTAEAA